MIHFDFVLDDIDAETLFSLFQAEINNLNMNICDEMAGQNRSTYIEWYRARIAYINELKTKLTHTRI